MKHGAVYAAYNVLSPGLIGGLVFSNTSTNLFSKSRFEMLRMSAILINFEKRFVEVFEETNQTLLKTGDMAL